MKRQKALRSAALLTYVILSRQDTLALDKVIIGFSSLSAVHDAIWVAEEKGLFKKHGLEDRHGVYRAGRSESQGVDPIFFVDGSIRKELDNSGFIKSLYER